jgi:hypothetical protein
MSRYSNNDTDWLMGAARRNPEAVLCLAAACCLLLRSGSSFSSERSEYDDDVRGYQSASRGDSPNARRVRDGLSRAADSASDYASKIKDRFYDVASSSTESISDFAEVTSRNVSEGSARWRRQTQVTLQGSINRVLRDQPLAVALARLAAGAAVAAVLPSTQIEGRTLEGAREVLTQAAGEVGESVLGAAANAGERLKGAAEERVNRTASKT